MTIYFAGAMRDGQFDKELYADILNVLKRYGSVLPDTIGYNDAEAKMTPQAIFEEDLSRLLQADVVVAEVSVPRLGVGYEIGVAAYLRHKPVLALYHGDSTAQLSSMIAGSPSVVTHSYTILEDLPAIFDGFFSQVKQGQVS